MSSYTFLQNNFSAGETSPSIAGRVDLVSYHNGCRIMLNAVPKRGGGFRRRPGTYWDGLTASATQSRIIAYRGKLGNYQVELTNNHAQVLDAITHAPVGAGLSTPWTTADLNQLRFRSIRGELYVVHRLYSPRKIYESGGSFAMDNLATTPGFTGARTFASAGNYPSIIWFQYGRLGLGATDNEPDLYALSRSPVASSGAYRLLDFTLGTNSDDAIVGTAGDEETSRLLWMATHKRLAGGAELSTWMGSADIPVASSFYMSQVGKRGSANIQAEVLDDAVFYIGASGTSLHMMVYSDDAGGFIDADLTLYYDHILKPGVVGMTVMTSPEPIIWLWRTDGVLVSCTVNQGAEGTSVGFARHIMGGGGLVESASVSRLPSGDELWLIVNRGGQRSREHLVFTEDDQAAISETHYVDAALRIPYGTPTFTITGLDYLEGIAVDAVGDGGSMPQMTVTGGQVLYNEDQAVSLIHIGLPFQQIVLPNRPELSINGTWQAKQKRVEKCVLRVDRSLGGKVGVSLDALSEIPSLVMGVTQMGMPPNLVTGDVVLPVAGKVDTDGAFYMVQEDPWPFTVLAAISRVAIMET